VFRAQGTLIRWSFTPVCVPGGTGLQAWDRYAILGRMINLIVGTNRPGSNTRKVAAQVEEIYRNLGVPLHVLDLADMPQEIYLPSAYSAKPAGFEKFSDAVVNAHGLIVVTPEYNGSMPGVLKYFIDMLKFPESFCKRPVCFVGLSAGVWGALRPIEELELVFGYRKAFVYPERVFIPEIQTVLNAQGRIEDAEILGRLKSQAKGFIDFVERLDGVHLKENE
jgi:chromate reductase, NAD(P)H dehydrogenase (quinone)